MDNIDVYYFEYNKRHGDMQKPCTPFRTVTHSELQVLWRWHTWCTAAEVILLSVVALKHTDIQSLRVRRCEAKVMQSVISTAGWTLHWLHMVWQCDQSWHSLDLIAHPSWWTGGCSYCDNEIWDSPGHPKKRWPCDTLLPWFLISIHI